MSQLSIKRITHLSQRYWRQLVAAGFLFFLAKGMLWLGLGLWLALKDW